MDLADWITDSWPWPLTNNGTPSRQDLGIGTSGLTSSSQRGPAVTLRMRCADVGFDDVVPTGIERPLTSSDADIDNRASMATSDDPLVCLHACLYTSRTHSNSFQRVSCGVKPS
jgi:hypothetical protein